MASKKSNKSPAIIILSLGTFCDNSLMSNLVQVFKSENRVIFMTDVAVKGSSDSKNVTTINFKSPAEMTKSIDIPWADTSVSRLRLFARHWRTYSLLSRFITSLFAQLQVQIAKYKPSVIILPYTATFLLFLFSAEFLQHTPVIIIHYAPSYPNTKIPWLFDGNLRRQDFELYKTPAGDSGLENLARVSLPAGQLMMRSTLKIYKRALHFACWPLKSTQQIPPAVQGLHVNKAGAIFDEIALISKQWYGTRGPSNKLLKALETDKPKLFISMGTYARTSAGCSKITELVEHICKTTEFQLIIHGSAELNSCLSPSRANILYYQGWIPYEWIVPRVQCLISSGSLCLMTAALYNRVPIIFAPLLVEQYFWAKNYKWFTNVPYYVEGDYASLSKALSRSVPPTSRLITYLNRASEDLKKRKGTLYLKKYVSALIQRQVVSK